MTDSLTEGKIYKPLLRFALPVFAALFLQSLYGAVDLLIVGRFTSAQEVSAVSTGSQIMMTLMGIIAGLAMGSTVKIGLFIGGKDREKAGMTIGSSIVLFGFLGLLLSIIMIAAAPALSALMKAPPEAYASTVQYVRICGAAVSPWGAGVAACMTVVKPTMRFALKGEKFPYNESRR